MAGDRERQRAELARRTHTLRSYGRACPARVAREAPPPAKLDAPSVATPLDARPRGRTIGVMHPLLDILAVPAAIVAGLAVATLVGIGLAEIGGSRRTRAGDGRSR